MINQTAQRKTFQILDHRELEREQFAGTHKDAIAVYHYRTMWTYAVNCILGLCLLTGPLLFNYRSRALATSDMISGVCIIVFECLSFTASLYFIRWLTPVVALWLLFAPLVFWSPTPAFFLIDTLIASIVIAMSLLIPGTPGNGGIDKPGPDMPPDWTYNPSSWIRRWLGIALALLGFFISRYLAARQLGYINHPGDPFFGNASSDRVLHSVISRSFPISDAGFGSVAYMLEVLAGFMGDRARWRTSPWVVTTFAILVVPLGITSIVLVILQPVVVGAWCGLCLVAAVGLLTSVPLAVHEIIAMGLFMVDAKKRGKSFWRVFLFGGSIVGGGAKDSDRRHFNLKQRWVASVQGITVPWPIVVQIVLGVWLMARPDVIGGSIMSANVDHLLGAVIVTIAAVATAEVTRTARFLNVLAGLVLLLAAPFVVRDMPVVMYSEIISAFQTSPIRLRFVSIIK